MLTLSLPTEEHILLLTCCPYLKGPFRDKLARLIGGGVDWQRLNELVQRNKMGGFFLGQFSQADILSTVPAQVVAQWKAECQVNKQALSALLSDAIRMQNALATDDYLVFKGARLASTIYPDAGWRSMGDIDILVRPDMRKPAAQAMNELGYIAGAYKRSHGLIPVSRDGLAENDQKHFELIHRMRMTIMQDGEKEFLYPIGMDVHVDVLSGKGLAERLWENTTSFRSSAGKHRGIDPTLELIILAQRLYTMTMITKTAYRMNLFADIWWLFHREINNISWDRFVQIVHEQTLYPDTFYVLYHMRNLGRVPIPKEVLIEINPIDKYQYVNDFTVKRFDDKGDFLPKALNLPRAADVEDFV